jgi:hypothetical protein
LVNRLYVGEIHIKRGATVLGDFAPLVCRETFDRVQNVLGGRAPVFVPHVRERDDFPLPGLIIAQIASNPSLAA